jgi:hypothetical protein
VGHVASIGGGGGEKCVQILVGNPEVRRAHGSLYIDGKII